MSQKSKPDYGIDAPGVVRNLFIASGVAILVIIGITSGIVPKRLMIFDLLGTCIGTAIGCGSMGFYMLWSSKIGKIKEREKLLDLVKWRGDEQVLDIGCGRGLMLIGAAKRLSTGKAFGIDLWQQEDLLDNRPDATLENAKIEGVANLVEVKTADMRKIPFEDGTFDVIVSCAAIHNLYQAEDREQTMKEIARVLKAGGQVVLEDIRHGKEYQANLAKAGLSDAKIVSSTLGTLFFKLITFGNLAPVTLLASKSK
jgi:ubiquinone/menaquinone biosynthesis C-methylase UbiE